MLRSPEALRLTVTPIEDGRVIRAAGEVDLSSVDALRCELDAARDDAVSVVLDLSGVTFIDSTGLHLLLETSRASATSDWAFFVVRPSAAVRRLIEISGTGDLLTLVDPGPGSSNLAPRASRASPSSRSAR